MNPPSMVASFLSLTFAFETCGVRKVGDSNPRYGNPVRQFSKLVVSATHPTFLLEALWGAVTDTLVSNAVQRYGFFSNLASFISIIFQEIFKFICFAPFSGTLSWLFGSISVYSCVYSALLRSRVWWRVRCCWWGCTGFVSAWTSLCFSVCWTCLFG